MDLNYRKFKGRRNGPCNVCGVIGPLTWDHVPPKGGIELGPVEIDRVAATISSSFVQERPVVSNDGLKFRTLCAQHNSYLGSNYDPALNDFALTVSRFLRTSLLLPRILHVEVRPTAVVRAVLGHILAARLSSKDSYCDHLIREIILNPDDAIPYEINVFYWVYPYSQHVVLRNAIMPLRRGDFSGRQQFALLKYFPIAYLVTTAPAYEDLDSLTSWRNQPSSATVKIPVSLQVVRDQYWPEAPTPDNFLFGGEDLMQSVQAHPARARLGTQENQGARNAQRLEAGFTPIRR